MIDMTLMRPLNKGQGHSFWYHRYVILSIVTFAHRTHRLATIYTATSAVRIDYFCRRLLVDYLSTVD